MVYSKTTQQQLLVQHSVLIRDKKLDYFVVSTKNEQEAPRACSIKLYGFIFIGKEKFPWKFTDQFSLSLCIKEKLSFEFDNFILI